MSIDWVGKAKEAAQKAAEEAKKMAEKAKNANYGEMFDKTKEMAMHAAEEAKKAADNLRKKEEPETAVIVPEQDNPQTITTPAQPTTQATAAPATASTNTQADQSKIILAKLQHVELLLTEIKNLLNKV